MIGTTLQNRYRIDRKLGRGGIGVVYRARDILLERDIAIKVMSVTDLGSEGRARLMREARAAASLNHVNIVTVHDVGEADPTMFSTASGRAVPFIVMELVEGRTLQDLRPSDLDEILPIVRQVCDALDHAHAHGIVHRDFKPENVIITADGTAKLTDFGLARSMASRVSTDGTISGTVFYLSPEQALGQKVDGRADLYALGVTLYELVTGRLPFSSNDPLTVISQHLHAPIVPPRTYNAKIPPALDALIVQMLSKQPQDRPASAAKVRQALDDLVGRVVPLQQRELSLLDQLVRGRMVGREGEFAAAKALWKQTVSAPGERNVLLISGEPGVGKTRLMREIRTLAEVSWGRALTGKCYAEGSAPYAPIAQVIREALPLLEVDLPKLVLAGLIVLAPDLQPGYPDVPPNLPLDPQAEQQRLFESVVALLSALTDRTTILLVVENVQWADDATLFLLRHLARRSHAAKHRLLILMTYREAELDKACCLNDLLYDLHRERLAVRIKLACLNREQTRDLLAVMFQTDISDEFVDGIYRETQGNPFFIEEVCKALIDEGKIYRENTEWQRSSMEEIRIPQSVRLAIQSRVGKLPSQAQDVLRLAAIVGREFDFATLQKASGLDEEVLIDALEIAEQAQLIGEVTRAGQETFAFAHGLTMTALREGISGLRRRRLHRRVAAVIEDLRPGDLEALAYHYGEAGDEERALAYILRAADRAHKVYANEEAIRLYSEALDLMPDEAPGRFAVLAARNQVYGVAARREAQSADVAAMLTLAEELDDDGFRCDALIAQADFYLETKSLRAREPAERAVAIAQRLGDLVREGHALRRLGWEAWYRYDYRRSRDALEVATVRFREARLPAEAAICSHMLALVLGNQGEHSAALKVAEDALALSRTAGDRRQEAISLRRLAIVYLNTFEHAQALPFAEAALALHRELGDRSEECKALNVLGVITGWLGRAGEAERYFFQSLELAEAIASSMGVRAAITNLLWSHFYLQGEYEAALAFVEERLTKARQAHDQFLVGHIRSQKPRLLGFLGQYMPALELLQTILPTLEELMGKVVQAMYLSYMGRLRAELGEFDLAHQDLEAAFESAGQTVKAVDRATLLIDQAYVALLEGGETRLRLGLEQTSRVIALLKNTGAVIALAEAFHVAARLRLELDEVDMALKDSAEANRLASTWPSTPHGYFFTYSRALRAAGREAEADHELQRAYERVMSVASRIKAESLRRSWLENVRENREILAEWAARRALE